MIAIQLEPAGRVNSRMHPAKNGGITQEPFKPACALYGATEFEVCGPFAQYTDDPNSAYATRALA